MNPRTVHRLLDTDEAARLLACLPGTGASGSVEVESVWAKPGRHFNVCYRIGVGPDSRIASLCIVSEAEAARTLRRIERSARSREGMPFTLAADDVLAQSFPCDYRLEHLPACLQPEVVHASLGDGGVDRCEVAAYRAGMRCQIRYLAGDTVRAYGKIAFDREPGRRSRVHREIFEATASTTLRLPAPVATLPALGLDLVEAVGGRSLYDLLAESPDVRHVTSTMAALCQLHRETPPPRDRVHTCDHELALVRAWAEWMSVVDPSLGEPLRDTVALLAGRRPSCSASSFAHRDFHDKQVLVDDACLWLLDTDTACTGDPEMDVGNFLAHLFLRGVQRQRTGDYRRLEEAAVGAYGDGILEDATRWYRRASLVRLACVYSLRPRWGHVARALLEEAANPSVS